MRKKANAPMDLELLLYAGITAADVFSFTLALVLFLVRRACNWEGQAAGGLLLLQFGYHLLRCVQRLSMTSMICYQLLLTHLPWHLNVYHTMTAAESVGLLRVKCWAPCCAQCCAAICRRPSTGWRSSLSLTSCPGMKQQIIC
jgi:uncharacterized membrane protein (DUF2068 family)